MAVFFIQQPGVVFTAAGQNTVNLGPAVSETSCVHFLSDAAGVVFKARGVQQVNLATAPLISNVTINLAGMQAIVVFTKPVIFGADGPDGLVLSMDGGIAGAVYASGSGTNSWTFDIDRVILPGETGVVGYVQPGDGIQDAAGNLLATVSNLAVDNQSNAADVSPAINLITVSQDGLTTQVDFAEAVNIGPGGAGGMVLKMSSGDVVLTLQSGAPGTNLVFTNSRTVIAGETGTAEYVRVIDGIQDGSGNDLTSFVDLGVSNQSLVGAQAPSVQSAAIDAAGTLLTIGLNINGFVGVDGTAGIILNVDGMPVVATFAAGIGTTVLTFDIATPILTTEVVTLEFAAPADGIQSDLGVLMASFGPIAVVNGSTINQPPATISDLALSDVRAESADFALTIDVGEGSVFWRWTDTNAPLDGPTIQGNPDGSFGVVAQGLQFQDDAGGATANAQQYLQVIHVRVPGVYSNLLISDPVQTSVGPDPLVFPPAFNVAINTPGVISDPQTVSGLAAPTAISVNGSTGAAYSINGSPFTTSAGTVENGDEVRLQVDSAGQYNVGASSTITINGQEFSFIVVTIKDPNPAPVFRRGRGRRLARR